MRILVDPIPQAGDDEVANMTSDFLPIK